MFVGLLDPARLSNPDVIGLTLVVRVAVPEPSLLMMKVLVVVHVIVAAVALAVVIVTLDTAPPVTGVAFALALAVVRYWLDPARNLRRPPLWCMETLEP